VLTYVVHSKSTWITRLDPAGRPHFRAGLVSGAACCRHDMTISQAQGCVRVRVCVCGGGRESAHSKTGDGVSLSSTPSRSSTCKTDPERHTFPGTKSAQALHGGGGTWQTRPAAAEVPALWSPDPSAGSAPCSDPRRDSPSVRVQRGGGGGRPGGEGGGTWRTRPAAAVDPAVWSHDPGDGSATCPDPQSHSVTVLEERGGGGGWRRGRPGVGGGGTRRTLPAAAVDPAVWSPDPCNGLATCPDTRPASERTRPGSERSGGAVAGRAGRGDVGGRAHLTGRTKSLRAWLPRPWQCLGHLQISSRRLAQHQRAAGGRWRLVAGRGGWWRGTAVRTRVGTPLVPALGSPDPVICPATCGVALGDSPSIREQRGGGGGRWRGVLAAAGERPCAPERL